MKKKDQIILEPQFIQQAKQCFRIVCLCCKVEHKFNRNDKKPEQ